MTPEVFWANKHLVLESAEQCDAFLGKLRAAKGAEANALVTWVPGTPLYIAASADAAHPETNPWATFTHIVNCTATHPAPLDTYLSSIQPETDRHLRYLCLGIPDGKRGQLALGQALPVAEAWMRANVHDGCKVLVHCNHTRDRSVAVVVMLLIRMYMHVVRVGEEIKAQEDPVDKEEIRRVLVWLANHYPRAMPSRASLKQLNRYLIPAPTS
ncbi:tRNA A64-2'-O-ribosylphosphate transferase [Catenaria anguillulae PL171]|uniref:tRNA A64-2'-O-ribosylphosphate transferase n=1 Tax=Catenaria anguillulae PL171 TaxID=765915 RepID=A0A1Y2HV55_9FUNG|nr:tRNA A64-2'-O-ribosylphosphate transferase [Catenaria anguillulae PL171]